MTVLNRNEILELRGQGKLVIEPFDEKNLGPNSYDVTLGEWFVGLSDEALPKNQLLTLKRKKEAGELMDMFGFFNAPKSKEAALFNPYDQQHAVVHEIERAQTWGEQVSAWLKPHEEADDSDVLLEVKQRLARYQTFKDDDRVVTLAPGGTVMGHTQEFIGSTCSEYCTLLRTRSSWARWGVSFTGGSGWGDSGFFGRWGLRIVNHTSYWLPLLVGSRVAQIVFLRTSGDTSLYSGKYQAEGKTVEQLKEEWKPEMLLPQMWKDLKV